MDYCHPCGRHLNGALACAGCGTPVEELRHHSTNAPDTGHVYELDVEPEPARPGPRAARRQAQSRRKPASAGRRARKRRGRKVVLGTFGLVLAAGALSLAELAIEGSGGDGAATTVKEQDVVETETIEPSAAEDTPDGPGEVSEKPVMSSGSPRPAGSATGTKKDEGAPATGAGTGRGDGEGPAPSASASAGDGASPSATDGPPGDADPSGSGRPTSGPGDPDDPEPPGEEEPPPPEPSPTQTCDRFLWWCL
ncbi:SCO2400 family protein [Streptomyces sp. NPDC002867]